MDTRQLSYPITLVIDWGQDEETEVYQSWDEYQHRLDYLKTLPSYEGVKWTAADANGYKV